MSKTVWFMCNVMLPVYTDYWPWRGKIYFYAVSIHFSQMADCAENCNCKLHCLLLVYLATLSVYQSTHWLDDKR
jgi:hypothetical protein